MTIKILTHKYCKCKIFFFSPLCCPHPSVSQTISRSSLHVSDTHTYTHRAFFSSTSTNNLCAQQQDSDDVCRDSSSIWLNAERRIQYSPGHSALPQCLLHIHVIALEVYDDHTEILILGLTVQELHIWDKLLHPASLILYCHRRQLRWVAMKP